MTGFCSFLWLSNSPLYICTAAAAAAASLQLCPTLCDPIEAQEPKVLVFDEPTGNLDIANELLIIREARKIAHDKNITVFSSIHDLNQAMVFGDMFFFMKDGSIKFSGASEVFSPEVIREVYGVEAALVENDGERFIDYYKDFKEFRNE